MKIAFVVALMFFVSFFMVAYVNGQSVTPYNVAKQKFVDAKDSYEKAKSEFHNASNEYKKSKQNKTVVIEHTKTFLIKSLERMISHLELVMSKAENMKVLGDDEKATIIADLNSSVTFFESEKPVIQNATTPKELSNISAEMKQKWLEARKGIKRAVGLTMNAEIKKILDDANGFENYAENRSVFLKSKGIDTAKIEEWLVEYNEKLAAAEQRYESAKSKFDEISDLNEADQLLEDAHKFVMEAKNLLQDAHKSLKDIIGEIKKGQVKAKTIPVAASSD